MTFHDDTPGPRRPPRRGRDRGDRSAVGDSWDDGGDVFASADMHGAHSDHLREAEPNEDDEYDDQVGFEDEYDDEYEYEYDEYDEYDERPRVPRWLVAIGVILVIILVAVGGVTWWYQRQVDPPGAPGPVVAVPVAQGSSTSRIGELLADADVVSNSTLFNFYVSRKSAGPWLAGEYRLEKHSSFDEAIAGLDKGPGKPVQERTTKVTIPEGFTVAKILGRIHDAVPRLTVEDLQAALDSGKVPSKFKPDGSTSYEGLLFPATYQVGSKTSAVELLTEMAATMEERAGQLGLADAEAEIKSRFGVDVAPYDLLTVASLVQAEAANATESPKVAAVIYNRLSKDSAALTLGIDAVDNYGALLAGVDPAVFRRKAQPYNTRLVKGLPPTPISAPGEAALGAALRPADGPWLFYVLTEPGVHTFVTSNQEFLQAKALCKQRNLGCG